MTSKDRNIKVTCYLISGSHLTCTGLDKLHGQCPLSPNWYIYSYTMKHYINLGPSKHLQWNLCQKKCAMLIKPLIILDTWLGLEYAFLVRYNIIVEIQTKISMRIDEDCIILINFFYLEFRSVSIIQTLK